MRNKKLVVNLLSIGGIGILVGGILFASNNYFKMTKSQRDYLARNPDKLFGGIINLIIARSQPQKDANLTNWGDRTNIPNSKDKLEAERKLRSEIEISGPPFSSCRDMQLYFNNKVDWGSSRKVSFTGFEDSQLVKFGDQQYCGFYVGPYYVSIVSPQGKQVCNGQIWSFLWKDGKYKFKFETKNCRWRS